MSHKRYYAKAGFLWLANAFCRKKKVFRFGNDEFEYFYHPYNFTWLNERCVEIPLAREVLARYRGKRILEIGNVMARYDPCLTHTVVDKYEQSSRAGFHAEDAETFSNGAPYDLILSISTLEHVGWDETPRDPGKIGRTLSNLRGLLAPGGQLFFTAPAGYSPPLDDQVQAGDGFSSRKCLRRTNVLNEWDESSWEICKTSTFHAPYPFANAIVIATLRPLD